MEAGLTQSLDIFNSGLDIYLDIHFNKPMISKGIRIRIASIFRQTLDRL